MTFPTPVQRTPAVTSLGHGVASFIRRIFLLNSDPAPFAAACARDPVFARLVLRYRGLRPVLIADPCSTGGLRCR